MNIAKTNDILFKYIVYLYNNLEFVKTINWLEGIENFCDEYNISTGTLLHVINDPKVIPMIRGKSFEFYVAHILENLLPIKEWQVKKPFMNAQQGLHDCDVEVMHISTGKTLSIECKLISKGAYKYIKESSLNQFRVKCMRSRTLGSAKVKQLAPLYNVPEDVLQIHNDQYLPTNFSAVVTSIGNAFYKTNKDGCFVFEPSKDGNKFLLSLQSLYGDDNSLRDFSFSRLYIASSSDLTVNNTTGIKCTRGDCNNPGNCGFIPNYPLIKIPDGSRSPINKWLPIEDSLSLFKELIDI